jgi:hypothetical protein
MAGNKANKDRTVSAMEQRAAANLEHRVPAAVLALDSSFRVFESRDGIQERTLLLGFLSIISRVLRLEVSTLVFCLSTRCYSRTNLRFLH